MSPSLILATTLLASSPAQAAAPEMRVAIGDLDFTRASGQDEFVRRVDAASRDYCRDHIEIVTPDRLGDVSVCRAEMRRLAYRALPAPRMHQLAQAGRLRAIR
jgi:UrcA family protein